MGIFSKKEKNTQPIKKMTKMNKDIKSKAQMETEKWEKYIKAKKS